MTALQKKYQPLLAHLQENHFDYGLTLQKILDFILVASLEQPDNADTFEVHKTCHALLNLRNIFIACESQEKLQNF